MDTRQIRNLLIANRGEIVVRIARTAAAMGISTVAVYSDPDVDALHVRACDQAVALGGTTSAESYLDMPALIAAARAAGADAVHPGYGFLSESAAFAEAVTAAGLTWVGPRPETIAQMGDKVVAKRMMGEAGVPVLEDFLIDSEGDVREAAAALRLPIIVKAAAGGGGKGMRIVEDPAELPALVEACRREAATAFGDDRVFLERFLERPRHIEVQIAGDRHGNVIHLFERECSVQRRHQKVIEESPSATIDQALREKLCAAAVAAGETLGYESVGTVEFVVGGDGEPAFLEVNTRLQVEHPVTEAITGVDLVRLQLEVAEGRPLGIRQEDLAASGHAIEGRLYAEDPAADYLPMAGTVTDLRPAATDSVRWDLGVETGSVVSSHYDPMLGKVIARGKTRDEAARALVRALRLTHLHGPTTNRDLLCAVLEHPSFLAGDLSTAFLDEHLSGEQLERALAPAPGVRERGAVAAALSGELCRTGGRGLPSGWRNNRAADQTVSFAAGGSIDVSYARRRDGSWRVHAGDLEMAVERLAADASGLDLVFDGRRLPVQVSVADEADGLRWEVTMPDGHVSLVELPRFPDPVPPEAEGATRAPMHGQVVSVAVSVGERVEKGRLLCIVEAMKMEQQIVAPFAAIVGAVEVEAGDNVATGDVLVVLEEVEE